MLVGALMSVVSSASVGSFQNQHESLITFFHGLQVAIMMTIMTNLTQFVWHTCGWRRKNEPTHWLRWRPVYVMLLSTVLVNVQPMSILIIGSWGIVPNIYWTTDANPIFPVKTAGWMVQIFCTYVGFAFMFAGVCEATLLHKKVIAKWRSISSR
eukprot:TRINITY_DN43508_c0_g1_i1.p1 TRINITY_DN43508_c0_g1~~TRINITY_DN43508_c0_g1_i1.p1  ORF type:complete len:154 (+),score=33.51 TRINITY_DN43508_c0_g1_i1:324-785(+)